jgi:hypothetical protein
MKAKRPALLLEMLEGRNLLSISIPKAPAIIERVVKEHVTGTINGTFNVLPGTILLAGSGNFKSVGPVSVQGSLLGNILQSGQTIQGSATLSNAQGTVTLSLSARVPKHLTSTLRGVHYSVQQATGAYAGVSGSGTTAFRLHADATALSGTFSTTLKLTVRR